MLEMTYQLSTNAWIQIGHLPKIIGSYSIQTE